MHKLSYFQSTNDADADKKEEKMWDAVRDLYVYPHRKCTYGFPDHANVYLFYHSKDRLLSTTLKLLLYSQQLSVCSNITHHLTISFIRYHFITVIENSNFSGLPNPTVEEPRRVFGKKSRKIRTSRVCVVQYKWIRLQRHTLNNLVVCVLLHL